MKRFLLFISILFIISLFTTTTFADCRGCCSRHGEVICVDGVTQCRDGTSLSPKCQSKGCDKCGGPLISRADDKPKAIKKRLEEFKEETKPVIDYYKKQGRLIKINGKQSIEDVFKDILKVLKK